jgi:hypothetical protein
MIALFAAYNDKLEQFALSFCFGGTAETSAPVSMRNFKFVVLSKM